MMISTPQVPATGPSNRLLGTNAMIVAIKTNIQIPNCHNQPYKFDIAAIELSTTLFELLYWHLNISLLLIEFTFISLIHTYD